MDARKVSLIFKVVGIWQLLCGIFISYFPFWLFKTADAIGVGVPGVKSAGQLLFEPGIIVAKFFIIGLFFVFCGVATLIHLSRWVASSLVFASSYLIMFDLLFLKINNVKYFFVIFKLLAPFLIIFYFIAPVMYIILYLKYKTQFNRYFEEKSLL